MNAVDEIEAFLAELEREGVNDEQFQETMRKLYRSDEPATIAFCDRVCEVIRCTDQTLMQRATKLVPIFARFADLFGKPH